VNTPAAGCADLLLQYAALLQQSQQLLDAARKGDWDRVVELEPVYAATSQTLQEQERECKWTEAAQLTKRELIRAILAADQETRQLVEPRRLELSQIIGSLGTEMKLQKAYEG